jgi:hypothetical protein
MAQIVEVARQPVHRVHDLELLDLHAQGGRTVEAARAPRRLVRISPTMRPHSSAGGATFTLAMHSTMTWWESSGSFLDLTSNRIASLPR